MMTDEKFIEKYEELLDKGYCNCNEMNCLDNDVPRKILNIVKGTKLEAKQLLEENKQLKEQLKQRDEVIDEEIKLLENLKEQIKLTLDDYDKEHSYQNAYQQIDDVKYHYKDIKEILRLLQNYRGDNK